MSDIFISYARPDQALAQSLADDLKAKGFKVWWDTELLGSDDFYEVIYTALSNAKAAIVIWTKNSCRSRFVRDEARFALQKEKLIATKAPDCSVDDIPFGFQGHHTEDVTQRDKIVRAVERLGATSSTETTVEDEATAWKKVKTSKDPDQLVQFVDQHPMSPNRHAALMLVRTLFAQGAATSSKPEIAELRTSTFAAFFQGLTFRIPSFQLGAQGVWSSLGLGVAFLVVGAGALATLMWFYRYARTTLHLNDEIVAAIMTIVWGLACFFGWRQFHKWVAQRLFLAATIAVLVNAVANEIFIIFVVFVVVAVATATGVPEPSSPVYDNMIVLTILVTPVAALVYGIWAMWRAR